MHVTVPAPVCGSSYFSGQHCPAHHFPGTLLQHHHGLPPPGPFTDTVQVSQGRRVKEQWDREMRIYDADVIMTSSKRPRLYIYNEPDSIPVSCARTDFSLPLSQRATNKAFPSGPTAAGADTHAQPQPTAPGGPPRT